MVGPTEMFVIFLIVLVLFGASRLPQLGKGLGEGIRNFKQGLSGKDELPPAKDEDSDAKD